MSKEPRKVVIVREFGGTPLEESKDVVDAFIRNVLTQIERNSRRRDDQHHVPAEVEVVNMADIEALLQSADDSLLVLFMTNRALPEARRLKRQNQRHSFVLFTSDPPTDGVFVIHKQMIGNDLLRGLVRFV